MAESVGASGVEKPVAADIIEDEAYQRIKLTFGEDGTAVDVSADNPLPVEVATLPLPTGAATESTLSNVLTALADVATETTLAVIAAAIANLATESTLAALNAKVAAAKTADLDTSGGTDTVAMQAIALPASGGAVVGGTSANPIRVDPTGTTPQPITASSLPLPTGAATETTVAAINTKLAAAKTADLDSGGGTDTVQLQGIALPGSGGAVVGGTSANPLRTDPTGTTPQPISAATLPLPTGAATESTLAALNTKTVTAITVDYDTSGGTQAMPMHGIAIPGNGGAVAGGTSANPVRTDPTGTTPQPVTGTFWQATQPVSGTFWQATQPVSIAANVAVVGAAAHDAAVSGAPVLMAAYAHSTGQTAVSANGDAVRVWADLNGRLVTNLCAAVTTSDPSYSNATTNFLSLTTAGRLRADVTGTVAVTGTFWQATQPISAASLPLPTGAAADATLTGGTVRTKITDGTTNAAVKAASTAAVAADPAIVVAQSPNNRDTHDAAATTVGDMLLAYAKAAAPSNVSADADAVRLWALLNGALCVNITAAGALIPGDATSGLKVDVARGATPTQANVTAATSSTAILSADATRKGVSIWNDSTADMYLSYGSGTASATDCSVKVAAGGYFEVPAPFASCQMKAIWSAVNGAARVASVV